MMDSITVIVLNYNYEEFLKECLDSLLEQKRRPTDIVIMDDHSTLPPGDLVKDFTGKAAFHGVDVIYQRNEKNLGTPGNMNEGLKLAMGRDHKPGYLMFLGADNFLHEEYLSKTAALLDVKPGIGVVYTDAVAFGQMAEERSRHSTWFRNRKTYTNEDWGLYDCPIWEFLHFNSQNGGQMQLRVTLKARNFIHGSSLFRRQIVDQGARMRTDLERAEDWDFWKQAILSYSWGAMGVEEPLLFYRQHSSEQRNVPKI